MRLLWLQSLAPCHAGSLSQARSARGVQGRPKLCPACLPEEGFFLHSAPRSVTTAYAAARTPARAPAQERRAPLGVLSVPWPGPAADLGGVWKPRSSLCGGLALLTRRRRCTASPAAEAERLRAGLGRPQAPGESQRDIRLLHVRRSFPEAVPRAQGCGSSAEDSAWTPLQLLRGGQAALRQWRRPAAAALRAAGSSSPAPVLPGSAAAGPRVRG